QRSLGQQRVKFAAAPVLGVQEVLGGHHHSLHERRRGSTRWKVEGKTGNQGGAKRLQMKLSERGNEKTQPAGWVFFRTNSRKLRITQRECGVPVDGHATSCQWPGGRRCCRAGSR